MCKQVCKVWRICQSFAPLHLYDQLVTTLATTVLSYQHIDVLLSLPRQEQPTDLRSALRQLQLLQQLSLIVKEGKTAILGKRSKLEESGDEDVVVSVCESSGSKPACELMEEAAYLGNYLMQQMPSLDSQNRKILFRPVSATQIMRSSWLKARPVGAERHLRAIERMLCCCISITKRDPLLFDATFSPKAPQSVKKMFPVVLESRSEWGPRRGAPSYSLTSSVYCESLEREMMDCLSRSVRQQQFLAWSQATALTWPLTFANNLS